MNTSIKNIKGLILDYGGTIDTNGVHWSEVIYKSYIECGVNLPKSSFRNAYVYAEREMEKEQHLIKPSFTFREVMELKIAYQFEYLAEHEHLDNAKVGDSNTIAYCCYNFAKENIKVQHKTLAVLAEKYPLVLVSNFYGNLSSVLKDFNIARYFKAIVESSVVGVRKPNSDIFLLGVQSLKLNPTECAVIGDSYTNDIIPAKQLACITIWLKGIGWETEATNVEQTQSDFIIDKLENICELFAT